MALKDITIYSWKKYLLHGVLFMSIACVDSFTPKVSSSNISILVVDGFINSGEGPTTFRLTRTQNISDVGGAGFEKNAQVVVEGEDNSKIALKDGGDGNYTTNNIALSNQKYRLRIITSDKNEFVSDFVEVKKTPAITGVNWQIDRDGLNILVDTNDPTNATRYYQWEYEETWQLRSEFCTNLEYKNGKIVVMNPFVDIHNCWNTKKPKDKILVGSSSNLSQDVIRNFPITSIPSNSEKLGVEYSILVKQHALTKENYEYLLRLKKNTEQLGSIFDPQPSTELGNIHCVSDSALPVIGFVGGYDVNEKRIFIPKSDLVDDIQFRLDPKYYCYEQIIPFRIQDDSIGYVKALKNYYESGFVVPISPTDSLPGILLITDVPYADVYCVDCRFYGTNVKPDFWPEIEVRDNSTNCN